VPFTIETKFVAYTCNTQHAFIDNEKQSKENDKNASSSKSITNLEDSRFAVDCVVNCFVY